MILAIVFLTLYFSEYRMYYAILYLCSIFKVITIRPILACIDIGIATLFRKLDRIQHNIKETFIVKSNKIVNPIQAIYIFHPHGFFAISHGLHIGTNATNWPHKNVFGVMHHILSKIPFLFDFSTKTNAIDSRYSTIKSILQMGNSVSLSLGNITEGKYTDDKSITAIVKNRNGIFKIAIETGVPIIPVLSYGEQCLFKQLHTYGILEYISKWIGLHIVFPDWPSFMNWISIYKEPLPPIYTHIGQPIDVGKARIATAEEIRVLKEKYIEGLRSLYKETRPSDYADEIIII
jgi:hypothetical protein